MDITASKVAFHVAGELWHRVQEGARPRSRSPFYPPEDVAESRTLIALSFLEHSAERMELRGQSRFYAKLQSVHLSGGFAESHTEAPNQLLLRK